MLDRIVTFCLSQRVFVLVLVAALAGFGVRAALNLRIEAFPDVQDVQVQVIAQFPGQAPEEMERLVALPIEREMAGVPRLMQLRSVSITGLSVVTLTFAEGTDDYFARQQVLEKLQIVNLPPGVQPQLAPLSNALGEIYRYALEAPPDMPSYEVRAIQDWIVRPYLRIVPGVADVISFGGTVKEYQVRLNPFHAQEVRGDDRPGRAGARQREQQRRRRAAAPGRGGARRARHRALPLDRRHQAGRRREPAGTPDPRLRHRDRGRGRARARAPGSSASTTATTSSRASCR